MRREGRVRPSIADRIFSMKNGAFDAGAQPPGSPLLDATRRRFLKHSTASRQSDESLRCAGLDRPLTMPETGQRSGKNSRRQQGSLPPVRRHGPRFERALTATRQPRDHAHSMVNGSCRALICRHVLGEALPRFREVPVAARAAPGHMVVPATWNRNIHINPHVHAGERRDDMMAVGCRLAEAHRTAHHTPPVPGHLALREQALAMRGRTDLRDFEDELAQLAGQAGEPRSRPDGTQFFGRRGLQRLHGQAVQWTTQVNDAATFTSPLPL